MLNQIEINQILQSFAIKASCINLSQHRHLGFYDLKLDPGFKISKLQNSMKEISLFLKSKTVPLLQEIYEEGVVRMHVVHSSPEILYLDKIDRKKPEKSVLPLCIGETADGHPFWMEMNNNPHLLVAGTTGSGKSTLLLNILWNLFQENVEIYLADPKRVDFANYSNSDKIFCLANSYDEVCLMLEDINEKMEQRYNLISKSKKYLEFMNKIVIIIDEIADLMLQDSNKRFENLLVKLASKSRASGIYIIIATQRPSIDVVTGLIKANFPARIACKTASRIDSQVILDEIGAEKLLGKGDALFKNPEIPTTRIQIGYIEKL